VAGFLFGRLDEVADLGGLRERLAELRVMRFSHCCTVVCIDVSSGGSAAMLTAE